jgi:hypothetical protein
MDELRHRKIIAPGASVIERVVAAAATLAERQITDQLTRGLLPAQAEALDALLTDSNKPFPGPRCLTVFPIRSCLPCYPARSMA